MFNLKRHNRPKPRTATVTASVAVTKLCMSDKAVQAKNEKELANYVVETYNVGSGEKHKVPLAIQVAMNSNRLSFVVVDGVSYYEPARLTKMREAGQLEPKDAVQPMTMAGEVFA